MNQLKSGNSDAEKRSLLWFSDSAKGRQACAKWLEDHEMMDFVRLVANEFFDGKLPHRPECYQVEKKEKEI